MSKNDQQLIELLAGDRNTENPSEGTDLFAQTTTLPKMTSLTEGLTEEQQQLSKLFITHPSFMKWRENFLIHSNTQSIPMGVAISSLKFLSVQLTKGISHIGADLPYLISQIESGYSTSEDLIPDHLTATVAIGNPQYFVEQAIPHMMTVLAEKNQHDEVNDLQKESYDFVSQLLIKAGHHPQYESAAKMQELLADIGYTETDEFDVLSLDHTSSISDTTKSLADIAIPELPKVSEFTPQKLAAFDRVMHSRNERDDYLSL